MREPLKVGLGGPSAVRPGYREAAWSWTQHLRSAGSTPWARWAPGPSGSSVPEDWPVPGAAQLELVRRLAERGRLRGPAFTGLADLALGRSGPGRGLAQQPLPWTGAAPPYGAPPVDPCEVPVEELLRVGAGALTELLLAAAVQPGQRATVRRRLLSRTPAFELAGPPVTTSVVRRRLALAGHVEGGRAPTVLLLVEPLDRALAQAWSARVQAGAAARWQGFARRSAGRPELPAGTDLPAVASRWADRVGASSVHLVVAGTSLAEATARAGEVLGVRTAPSRRTPPVPPDPPVSALTPAAVDVVRRVNAVLDVRVPPGRRPPFRRLLVRTLRSDHPVDDRLTVPAPLQEWARERGAQAVRDLRSAGHPVHGSLQDAVPRFEGLATHPRRADTLGLLLDACLALASRRPEGG